MKKRERSIFVVLLIVLSIVVTSCSSTPHIRRLKATDQYDLSGSWNDLDIQIVTEALVESSLRSNWINQFRVSSGKNPVVVVGSILNRSSEHLDTEIIAKLFEMALINTQKVDMVADIGFRDQIRSEREEQQYYASEESAVRLGRELGADFLLQGSVRTVIDQIEGKSVRTYYVSAELVEIETSKKVWVGQETIKKFITQPKYRL